MFCYVFNKQKHITGNKNLLDCYSSCIFGVSLFVLFRLDLFSKKQIKKYNNVNKIYNSNICYSEISQSKKQQLKNSFGLANYINNSCKIPVYSNTDVKYFSNGENYFNYLISDLKNAKHFIFLNYFIIAKGNIWSEILDILKQKVKENIEVFIIYDDFGTIAYLEANYYKKLRNLGIKCVKFNNYSPFINVFQNCRNHQKLAIIDNDVAYMGGINIADEYANIVKPLKYWKDSGIRLCGQAVESCTLNFLKMYCLCIKNFSDINFKKYLIKHTANSDDLLQPFFCDPNGLCKNNIAQNIYKSLINNAKNYIYITSPYVVLDYGIINDLIFAVKRGVDVRIIIPSVPDKKLTYFLTKQNTNYLLKNGVKIYSYSKGFIHSKQLICDSEIAVVGSVNLDYRSFLHQFENGVILYSKNTITDIKKDFDAIFKDSKQLTKKDIKSNIFKKILFAVLKIIAPLL